MNRWCAECGLLGNDAGFCSECGRCLRRGGPGWIPGLEHVEDMVSLQEGGVMVTPVDGVPAVELAEIVAAVPEPVLPPGWVVATVEMPAAG